MEIKIGNVCFILIARFLVISCDFPTPQTLSVPKYCIAACLLFVVIPAKSMGLILFKHERSGSNVGDKINVAARIQPQLPS